MKQPTLPGTNRANHAHLGRNLEDLLDRTHSVYAVQKKANIEKNPVEWVYTSQSQYNTLRNNRADIVAVTNNARYIKRKKSDVDYAGVVAPSGRFITFDAKETTGKSFPLSNVAEHQIQTLLKKAECGALAGLMIYFSDLDRLFFLEIDYVDAANIEMLYKKGRKSIPLADCIDLGTEIPIHGNLADWYSVLFAK
jgi:Penicillin-binding protein-related factor A, putative recombinase